MKSIFYKKRNARDPIRFFIYLLSKQNNPYEFTNEQKRGFFVISSSFRDTNPDRPRKKFNFIEFAIINNNSGKINFKTHSIEKFKERLNNSPNRDDSLAVLEYNYRYKFRVKRFFDMIDFFQVFDQRKTVNIRYFINSGYVFLEFEINDRYSLVISEFNVDLYQKIMEDPLHDRMSPEIKKERLTDYLDLKLALKDGIDDLVYQVDQELVEKLKAKKHTASKPMTTDSVPEKQMSLKEKPKESITIAVDQELIEKLKAQKHIASEPIANGAEVEYLEGKEGSENGGLEPETELEFSISEGGDSDTYEKLETKKPLDTIALLQRKATIYIKQKGFQVCKELNQHSRWTDSQISNQFISNRFFIPKLLSMGLLKKLKDSEVFEFAIEEKDSFLAHFNRKRIIDWSIKHYEEKLQSLDGYRDFINLTYENEYRYQTRFFQPFNDFLYHFFKRISYWEEIGSERGKLLFYLKGRKYFEMYNYEQRRKNIEKYFSEHGLSSFDDQVSEIKNTLRKYELLTQNEEYDRLGKHFSICVNSRCKECGGNILNIMMLNIEPIRKKIIDELILRNELKNLKELPYNKALEAVRNLAEQFTEFAKIDTKFEDYCKSKNLDWAKRSQKNQRNHFIPALIEHSLWLLIYNNINRMYAMKLITLDLQRKNRKNRTVLEYVLENYKNSVEILNKLVTPLTFLSAIERRLSEPFIYNEKAFQVYDKEIKKIGREGEKIVYEGLKEEYRDNQGIEVVWVNENVRGTGIDQPYDILIRYPNREQEYIEVKTSHSSDKSFTMSQNEINFAEKNKKNYSLYLITNLGKGFDTELEKIEDVYEKIKKNKIQSVSQRFKL